MSARKHLLEIIIMSFRRQANPILPRKKPTRPTNNFLNSISKRRQRIKPSTPANVRTIFYRQFAACRIKGQRCNKCNADTIFDKRTTQCALCVKEEYMSMSGVNVELNSVDADYIRTFGSPEEYVKIRDAVIKDPSRKPKPCVGCGIITRPGWAECSACVKAAKAWNKDITPVLPGLFIGKGEFIRDNPAILLERDVHIVCVYGSEASVPTTESAIFYVVRTDIDDKVGQKISQHFSTATQLINSGHTLVHCQAGVSRSASIVIAYLMYLGMSFRVAYCYLYNFRPILNINDGFMQELYAFDTFLNENPSYRHQCTVSYPDDDARRAYYDCMNSASPIEGRTQPLIPIV